MIPERIKKYQEFKNELEKLINRYSMENISDTPDFILANYLCECLEIWDRNVNAKTIHRGE